MLISRNLHKKSIEISIKTRSPPASFSFKSQATKHTTVKWSIPVYYLAIKFCLFRTVFLSLFLPFATSFTLVARSHLAYLILCYRKAYFVFYALGKSSKLITDHGILLGISTFSVVSSFSFAIQELKKGSENLANNN